MRASHGACGAVWDQNGNRTSHCSGCHVTFGSLSAFERHQHLVDGDVVCRHPRELGLHPRTDRYGAEVWKSPPPAGGFPVRGAWGEQAVGR